MSNIRRPSFQGFRNMVIRSGEFSRTIRLGLPLRGAAERLAAENPTLTRLLTIKKFHKDFGSEGRKYVADASTIPTSDREPGFQFPNTGVESDRFLEPYRGYRNTGAEYIPKSTWNRMLYSYLDPSEKISRRGSEFILDPLADKPSKINEWEKDSATPVDPYRESKRGISEMIRDMQAEADAERAKRARRTAKIDRLIAKLSAQSDAAAARRSAEAAGIFENFSNINILKPEIPPKENFINTFQEKPRYYDPFKRDTKINPWTHKRDTKINPWTHTPYDVDPDASDLRYDLPSRYPTSELEKAEESLRMRHPWLFKKDK